MGSLTDSDREYLLNLKEQGILSDVDPNLLNQENGVIIVCCSDGDEIADLFTKQSEYVLRQCQNPRIHVLALNGGAINLPPHSPLNTESDNSEVLFKNLSQAVELKEINMVILYAHAPCGGAKLCNLSVKQVVDLLVEAKSFVKEKFPGIKAACFFHVDWSDHKRTYFISADKWQKFSAAS